MRVNTIRAIKCVVCGFAASIVALAAMLTLPYTGEGKAAATTGSNEGTFFKVTAGLAEIEDDYAVPEHLPAVEGGYKYGNRITFFQGGAKVEYKTKLNISGGDDSIIKMIMAPAESFADESKAELANFTIRVADAADTTEFFEFKLNTALEAAQSNGMSYTVAYAARQVPGGEHNAANNHELRLGSYGNPKSFSFAGINNKVLDVTYNNTSTALKALPIYGSYGETVRIFNKPYIVADATWEGFDEDSEVIITITAGDLYNGAAAASIIVFEAGGEPAVNGLTVRAPSYGIEGMSYEIPEPSMLTLKGKMPFAGDYSVTAPGGEVIASGTYANGTRFDTDLSGVYQITYTASGGEDSANLDIMVLAASQAADYPIILSGYTSDYSAYITTIGTELPLGAESSSAIDITGNHVNLIAEISSEAGAPVVLDNITADTTYSFEAEGEYSVVYIAVDYTGREQRSNAIPISIKRYYVGFTGINEPLNVVISSSDERFFSPSAADITIYDYVHGKVDDEADVTVWVKGPADADYVEFDDDYGFLAKGDYVIRYAFEYHGISGQAERILRIVDGKVPIINVEGMPSYLKTDLRKQSGEFVIYLIGETGAIIPALTVSVSNAPALEPQISWNYFGADGVQQDLTAKLGDAGYSLTLGAAGVHTLMYRVTNSEGLIGSMVYVIDIRESWHTLTLGTGGDTALTSSEVKLKGFEVRDFANSVVSGVRLGVKITINEVEVHSGFTDSSFNLVKPGKYYVEYSADEGVVADPVGYWLTVSDDTKPVITVNEPMAKGKVGEKIEIAAAVITDNDAVKNYTVSVAFNGEQVNILGGKFVAESEGIYTVSYRAEDISGNTSEYSYTVEITTPKKLGALGIILISAGSAAVVGGGTAGAVVLAKRRKKNQR